MSDLGKLSPDAQDPKTITTESGYDSLTTFFIFLTRDSLYYFYSGVYSIHFTKSKISLCKKAQTSFILNVSSESHGNLVSRSKFT